MPNARTTLVLNIQNNTGMVGWIKECKLHDETTWQKDQQLRDDLPISTGDSVQGTVEIDKPTEDERVSMSSLTVVFDRVPATTGPGSVLVQFGVQLVGDSRESTVQPFLGAAESNPWLVPSVDMFTDDETSIGLVSIDLFPTPG